MSFSLSLNDLKNKEAAEEEKCLNVDLKSIVESSEDNIIGDEIYSKIANTIAMGRAVDRIIQENRASGN